MRRHLVLALAIPTVAAVFVWGGCALVIDLGDEAKLRPTEASVESAAPIVDAGGDAGDADAAPAPVLVCGLVPVVNAECGACLKATCCEQSEACGRDSTCPPGVACIQDCLAQGDCITSCLAAGGDALNAIINCSATQCPVCTPKPKCQKLGECAYPFGDAGTDGLYRNLARGIILELDEDKCEEQRLELGKRPDAAATCQ